MCYSFKNCISLFSTNINIIMQFHQKYAMSAKIARRNYLMTYDENVFKEKANRKARKIWIVFAVLLSANYGAGHY